MATTRGPVVNNVDDWGSAPEPRGGPADGEGGTGESERIFPGPADVLVHQLFAVGLDLHSALTCIEADLGGDVTAERIHRAIDGLDRAIRDFRSVVFDLHPEGVDIPVGLRSMIVEAVERACAPAGARPVLTLGHGLEFLADQAVWQQAARLVHCALTLLPGDRLGSAHVAVAAEPRPPQRLVMHIDAPARDLAGVAGRLSALVTRDADADRMDVSCQDLPRSPERSRIRLEWRLERRRAAV